MRLGFLNEHSRVLISGFTVAVRLVARAYRREIDPHHPDDFFNLRLVGDGVEGAANATGKKAQSIF